MTTTTTFTISGKVLDYGTSDTLNSVNPVTLEITVPDDRTTFTYTIINEPAGDLPEVEIEADDISAKLLGVTLPDGGGEIPDDGSEVFSLGRIETDTGVHDILAIELDIDGTVRDFIFAIGGDPLDLPNTVSDWQDFEDTRIDSISAIPAGDDNGPDESINFGDLNNTTDAQGPNLVEGTDTGSDNLEGTDNDDVIITGDATINGDFVIGSTGNDTIDMRDATGDDSYVQLDYSGLTGAPITVDIEQDDPGAGDTVNKGANGTDTLLGAENPLEAGFGGFGITGTDQNDTFNIDLAPDQWQWIQVNGGRGEDTYSIGAGGSVRLDFLNADSGIDIDLATGTVNDDGFGYEDTIQTPGSVWEVRGTDNNDSIIGSEADESFILRAGDDTLDGAGGFDRLRYDRPGVDGVDANLQTGEVTGVWEDEEGTPLGFTHTVSNIELVRGSDGNDTIIGDDNDNRLEGGDGNDTLDGGIGNDSLFGGAGDDVINPGGGSGSQFDYIQTGTGSDTVDMSDLTDGAVNLDYSFLNGTGNAITATINGNPDDGESTVDKGGAGEDTLTAVENALFAGWTIGGLTLQGTEGNDTFDLSPKGEQWMSVASTAGTDSYNLEGDAAVRLDFGQAVQGINVDLTKGTNQIEDDGFGKTESITGSNTLWEVQGSWYDDTVTMTNADESFRKWGGGNDTIDGGGGFDRLRYDGAGVQNVNANLDTGIVTGTASGSTGDFAFTDKVSGFEHLRGSNSNDWLTGDDNDNVIEGGLGNDSLFGGAGDDVINPGGGSGSVSDYIQTGIGNDTVDMSDVEDGYLVLDYSFLNGSGNAITATINGDSTINSSIDKDSAGKDTLEGEENPLSAGWTIGGLALQGTDGDDTFILSPDDQQWMSVQGSAGADSYTINGNGSVRLVLGGGDQGIEVDLTKDANQIANDGFGHTESIDGDTPLWEIMGSANDDSVTLADTNQSFRKGGGGDDTLEGGGGFDRLRYDIFGIDGIEADLSAGSVTGTIQGTAFNDMVSGFEHLRGGNSDDSLTGDDNDNLIEAGAGSDTISGGLGDDTLVGGEGADTFIYTGGADVIRDFQLGSDEIDFSASGLTDQDIADAAASATESGGTATVDLGDGNALSLDGVTASEISTLLADPDAIPPAPPTPSGWTVGDPHLLTLDGVGYDFHAQGEFVLLRGVQGEGFEDFEIQSRMGPVLDDEGDEVPGVSANIAIAARVGGSDVMIDSADASPFSLDGTEKQIDDGDFSEFGADRVYREDNTYTVVFAGSDGEVNDGDARLTVVVHDGRVDLSVQISEEMAGKVEGLLGDGDGDPTNDIARADGTALERPLAYEDLYGDGKDGGLRGDWRVTTDEQSLFTYDDGETLEGFYDPDAPAEIVGIDDFDAGKIDTAREAAEDEGLTPGSVNFDNAVLDFLLTNDKSFIESSSDDSAPVRQETAAPAGQLDKGQERVDLGITLNDTAGEAVEDAIVGFTTASSTAPLIGQSAGAAGNYNIRLGDGVSGRVDARRDFDEESDPDIGVSDALDALRIAVNLEPNFGPAGNAHLVSADVDQSGDVNVGDALDILRAAVGLETENAPRWIFVDSENGLSSVADKDNVDYQTGTDIDVTAGASADLTGILLGNVDVV